MARRGAGEGPIFERADAEELCADGVLSIAEATGFLRLSRAELYRMMEQGRLVYVQHGRRRLIPRRAAVRLLAAGLSGGRSNARTNA